VSSEAPALELRAVEKRFGAIHANRGVSFSVPAGSIHGLIGENGAGKSTAMNIVFGYHAPDSGEIRIHGRRLEIRHPRDAIAAGIGMVHQHFMLVARFTALENIILGAEGGPLLDVGVARARSELERIEREYGLSVPLDARAGELPVGVQQRIEILKALYRGADVLILDEPTSVLTPQEADRLFAMLRRLREQGKTVILVTHKLREIMAATDNVTVMRQGRVVADVATARTGIQALADLMVGRPVLLNIPRRPPTPGAEVLSVKALRVRDRRGVLRVKDVSLGVRTGEIVGIAGVAGNGQSELLEAIAGLVEPEAGEIRVGAGGAAPAGRGARGRRGLGLAHVPEDRLRMGVIAGFSAADNSVLGYQDRPGFNHGPLSAPAAIRAHCVRTMEDWDVRPARPGLALCAFSGGNQQKLVLGRELDSGACVLLVGQPTRGVDIGAIEFIHRRLAALRDAGKAILLVSVELDEILALSDRILVMAGGEIAGSMSREEATEERIGLLMTGGAS
jgi:general nucleoside transport system ATP-binding protein